MEIPTVSLYGVPVSKMGMAETIDYLTDAVERRQSTQVVTVNPIMLMTGLDKSDYMAMLRRADLLVPDGTGVVWAAARIGQPVRERVAGFDLLHALLRVGASRGWKVYLLGATLETITATAKRLESLYPGIRIVGTRDGFFGPAEDEAVVAEIAELEPDLLFVGRSAATQEPWIDRYKDRLGVPVMMGVGGSFDVIAGKLKRAPVLFQRMRLEWLYRLLQEPWRFKRMLALPKFAFKVILEKEKLKKT